MVDTDYEAVPAKPKSARPRRTYTRKKAPVALPSSSDAASSSPRKAAEVADDFGGAGSEMRKRARNGELAGPSEARLKSKTPAPKRQRLNPAPSTTPAISLQPSSPHQTAYQPILPPMPPYGAAPSDPLQSDADLVPRPSTRRSSTRPRSRNRDALEAVNVHAPLSSRQSRSRSSEMDLDAEKPAQLRMSKLTASSAKSTAKSAGPFQLHSPIALGDKSNLPRGQTRPFTEHVVSSPFRAAPLPRPVRLASTGKHAPKPLAVFRDPKPPSLRSALNAPPEQLFAPEFSLSGLLGALPSTPSGHRARFRPPGLSTPFGQSPARRTVADQSLAALRSSPGGGSVIMGDGMDNSSIVLETYEDYEGVEEGDVTMVAVGARAAAAAVEDERMDDDEATVRADGREASARLGSAHGITPPSAAVMDEQAGPSSDWENEPTRGLGMPTATGLIHLDLSPQRDRAPTPGEFVPGRAFAAHATHATDKAATSPRPASVVGDGVGLFQALSWLSSPGPAVMSFSEPRPSPAPVNSPVQSPLRASAGPSILPSPVVSRTQSCSPAPDAGSDTSSPFPPRRPRQALAPARPNGPLDHEDDLAYLIATTATGSSDEDEPGAEADTSDSSHAEDERRWKASERMIGVGGEENRDMLDARKRKLARRKREIGQWMRRGMELRATEGESEDEIRIG